MAYKAFGGFFFRAKNKIREAFHRDIWLGYCDCSHDLAGLLPHSTP